jgi:hypothetical protein
MPMHMRIQLRHRPLYAVAEFVPPDTSHFPAGNVFNGLLDLYVAVLVTG